MKKESTPLAIAMEYFAAWSTKDFEKAALCLSENIVFEMPVNQYDTREQFIEAVRFTATTIKELNLLAKFGDDSEALLLYDMLIPPIGNLRIAEFFRVLDGKIIMIRHVHDTAALRTAGFEKQ